MLRKIVRYPLEAFTCLLLIALVIVVLLQIIYRYILASPLSWSEEISRYLLVWVSFFGAAVAVKHKGHFGLGFDELFLPSVLKVPISLLVDLAILGFVVLVLIGQGVKFLAVGKGQGSPMLNLPMIYVYLAIPTSGLAMAYYLVKDIWRLISLGFMQREHRSPM
ncbi:MAG: TRAP transporter small permease [Firmicutes bacterium]|nr:TRAP transporter small permease [Bacillota bacterium]